MLYESLLFLTGQLNKHFAALHEAQEHIQSDAVKLENVATVSDLENAEHIFLTLVHISEEASLKNVPHYRKEATQTLYTQPPVYLELYLLFSACYPKEYAKALMHLSCLIRFFQARNTFVLSGNNTELKLVMDLYAPPFEQTSHLWSTLGGKQHPSVLYKMRMFELPKGGAIESSDVITGI